MVRYYCRCLEPVSWVAACSPLWGNLGLRRNINSSKHDMLGKRMKLLNGGMVLAL